MLAKTKKIFIQNFNKNELLLFLTSRAAPVQIKKLTNFSPEEPSLFQSNTNHPFPCLLSKSDQNKN